MFRAALNGFGKLFRSNLAEREVNPSEMLAATRIELRIVRSAVLRTEPPAPIPALRCQQRFVCLLESCLGWRVWSGFLVRLDGPRAGITGVPEQFPRGDVFAVANPNIEVSVNPGGRKNRRGRRDFSSSGDGFTGSQRTEIEIGFHAAVKLAQKFAAIARVVFPGVFSVEKETNSKRLIAGDFFAEKAQT